MKSVHCSLLVLACQPMAWLPANAQNMLTVPAEIVRVSNPDLAVDSPGSVTLYRIHPQYTLRSINGSSQTELTLGALIEKSSNTELAANRTLPRLGMLWENSTPVDVYGLRASLEEASTRETEFVEFGRISRDSTQRTGTIEGTWNRRLTATSTLELLATHARVNYDTPLFIDYRETRGSVVYRMEPDARSRYSLSASVSRLHPDETSLNGTRGELGLGYQVDLREGVTLNAAIGAVRTIAVRNKTYPVGALRIAYTGERVGYAVGWTREVSAGSTVGGYTHSETKDASFTYPFTASTSLSLGFGQIRTLDAERNVGSTAYARIRSELTRFWSFTMGLEGRQAKRSGGPTAKGVSLAAGLVYSHPDF